MLAKQALVSAVAIIGTAIGAVDMVRAQPYPTRPITLVIPFPPGTNTDLVSRPLAERLASSLGQPVIIDYRPGGAGGSVGVRTFAKAAAPDGYTLLLSPAGPLVVAPAIYRDLGYDPTKDLIPVAMLFSVPQLLAVNATVPVSSLQELVAYAKTNPGKINFASPGYGTQPHLLGELLKRDAGVNIVHVPYKGPAQAMTDLLGGQVQMYFETVALFLPHVRAGKAKALAVADEARSPDLPNVPTTIESGFPDLQATYWAGVLTPSGTPTSIVVKLNAAITEIVGSPEMQVTLAKISAKPKLGSPQEFAAFMAAQARKWTEIVKAAQIKVE
jgi:tripartite-type tricarboxylate transporter receptor subunit TctC